MAEKAELTADVQEIVNKMHRVLDSSAGPAAAKLRTNALEGSKGYISQYPALLKMGEMAPETEGGYTILGLAVYGWMPTILKHQCAFDSDEIAGFLKSAARVANAKQAHRLLDEEISAPLLNNSWVGTSKFLHFLRPEAFPIWDSRTAGILGPNYTAFMAKKDNYLAYVAACETVVEKRETSLRSIRSDFDYRPMDDWTDMRLLEFLLFSHAKA